MTVQPQTADFMTARAPVAQANVFMRPNVTEHFWGFEVRPNEQVFGVAVLLRAMSGFFAGAAFISALGVWLLPAMAFVISALTAKAIVSVFLTICAVSLARVALRGTQVRVQIDSSAGELREVVDGAFGRGLALATYGLDSVKAVEVVESAEQNGFGQVQIHVNGAGNIPVGDGALSALAVLRDRIATECGLETSGPAREAVWGGPLMV